jgi:hypothetical protein
MTSLSSAKNFSHPSRTSNYRGFFVAHCGYNARPKIRFAARAKVKSVTQWRGMLRGGQDGMDNCADRVDDRAILDRSMVDTALWRHRYPEGKSELAYDSSTNDGANWPELAMAPEHSRSSLWTLCKTEHIKSERER